MKLLVAAVHLPFAAVGGSVGMPVPDEGLPPNTETATNIVVRLGPDVLEGAAACNAFKRLQAAV